MAITISSPITTVYTISSVFLRLSLDPGTLQYFLILYFKPSIIYVSYPVPMIQYDI